MDRGAWRAAVGRDLVLSLFLSKNDKLHFDL